MKGLAIAGLVAVLGFFAGSIAWMIMAVSPLLRK